MTAEQKKAAPVLSVNHVVKAFGAKRAVDDVTLDVMPATTAPAKPRSSALSWA